MPVGNSFVLILFLIAIISLVRRLLKLVTVLIAWYEAKTTALKKYRPH